MRLSLPRTHRSHSDRPVDMYPVAKQWFVCSSSCGLTRVPAIAFPRCMRYTKDVAPRHRGNRGVRASVVFGFLLIIAVAAGSWAGSVQPGPVTVEEWECRVPLLLSGGENQVAALDFHLVFDPAVFEPVAAEPGPAALRAGKMVTANAAEPGRFIVVVLGLNQTPLEDGVVAMVLLRRIGGQDGGVTTVAVQQPTLASWDGKALPSEGGDVAVVLPDREDTGEGEGSPEGETPEGPSVPADPEGKPSGGVRPGRLTTLAGESATAMPVAPAEGRETSEKAVETTEAGPIPTPNAEMRDAVAALREQAGESPLAGEGVPETGQKLPAESAAEREDQDMGRVEDAPRSLTIERRANGDTVTHTFSGEAETPAAGSGNPFRKLRGGLIAGALVAGAALLLVLRFRLFR